MKKEQKEEKKADEEETVEEAPVPLVTHVNKLLHSIFSNVQVYINNQQLYNSNGLSAHKSNISNNFKVAISECKAVCNAGGTTMKNFSIKIWKRFCLNLFSQGERKCLADLMAAFCMVI